MKHIKNISKNLAILFITSVLCVLFLEGAVRILHLVPINDYRIIFDKSLKNQMKPSVKINEKRPEYQIEISTNSSGFRDAREFKKEKTEGVLRVAIIGDSFTFGTGVQMAQRTGEILEKTLEKDGIGSEVYNFGIPATDTFNHVDVMKEKVSEYSPDIVVLMFYIGNDIIDNYTKAHTDENAPVKKTSLKTKLIYRVLYKSYLYKFLVFRVGASPYLSRLYNRGKTIMMSGETARQLMIFTAGAESNSELWSPTFESLRSFVSEVKNAGAVPIIALMPTKLQYDEKLQERVKSSAGLEEDSLYTSLPSSLLEQYLTVDLNVRVVQPLESFQKAMSDGSDIYYPVDGHWKPAGHIIAAESVVAEIEQMLKEQQTQIENL